jgi:hypothetical protein
MKGNGEKRRLMMSDWRSEISNRRSDLRVALRVHVINAVFLRWSLTFALN